MHELIESRTTKDDDVIQSLFVRRDDGQPRPPRDAREYQDMVESRVARFDEDVDDNAERFESYILSMKNGYGFIKYPPNNLFFHASDMLNADFQDLREGDPVEFSLGLNRDGDEVAKRVKLIFEDEDQDDAR
jgi:cold shock CspA family protein